jgi:uncharacterized membrane protein YecN with MAPEG domain
MTAPLTACYAAVLAILVVVLGLLVVRERLRQRVSLGDGGKPPLVAAIRVHGNAVENIPLALVLLLLLELNGASPLAIHAYGGVLVAGRLMHAWGLGRPRAVNRWRQLGMVLTWLAILGMAASLLVRAFTTLP